jgi:hypothetical protein
MAIGLPVAKIIYKKKQVPKNSAKYFCIERDKEEKKYIISYQKKDIRKENRGIRYNLLISKRKCHKNKQKFSFN